ncbi:hypothetical protein [Salmonirosea aquatica]|uniref:Uncharacterized protein n=1 Tax=Salmonirosea aquatica TaxID=2654236 RepID=A0A7C9BMS1_9BACT|nr:hypothetical protein [Cytophagaceae bacterium SJW1-29]
MIDALATGLTFLPLKFTRNALLHRIEAADPALTSRVGLSYQLTLLVPEFPFSGNLEALHTSEGREAPVEEQGGIQRYAGAEFRYNGGRNGKLDGLLSHAKPRRAQNVLSLSLTQTTAFCLRENVTGGLPAVNLEKTLPKAQAIKAGLANEDFVAFGEAFWNVWQAEHRQFLTWQPDHKRVGRSQEEYLYFLLNISPAPEQVRLRVQHYPADGSIPEAVTVLTLDNPLLYAVVGCPVGAAVLGIPATVTRYEVWLSDQNDRRLSETRTYLPDDAYQPQERSVLFVNSLGAGTPCG